MRDPCKTGKRSGASAERRDFWRCHQQTALCRGTQFEMAS